ncbi:preprotein translocase subunit YajC [Aquihabitans sp. G128]|uniref:preprotein translocase subunit YajC n=1 Tax=Aquihabitans sp. G128 TaxID=2849779 RepID=UPI001C220C50|nr:preprotein translocase subunit YajC [Aquihabitans sp. G128]QXC61844.1 preprotein translocase subunit YajC [Aquihabitans sp. G128]
MPQLILTLLLIGIGWFFLIRPMQARAKAQQATIAVLQPGDRVITAGGIHGVLTEVHEETVQIEVAPGLELTLARPAIARRLDPEDDTQLNSSDLDANDGVEDGIPGRTGDHAEDNVTHETDGPSTGGPA